MHFIRRYLKWKTRTWYWQIEHAAYHQVPSLFELAYKHIKCGDYNGMYSQQCSDRAVHDQSMHIIHTVLYSYSTVQCTPEFLHVPLVPPAGGLCRSGCWRQPDHKAVAICQYRLRQHAIAMYKCWLRCSYSGLMITSKRHCMSDIACHIPCALAASWPGPRRNPYPRSIVMDSLPSMVRLPSLAHDMGTAPCIDPCTSPGGDTVMPLVGTAAIPYVGDVRFTSTKLLARSFAVSFACLLLVMLTTVYIMFTSKVIVT